MGTFKLRSSGLPTRRELLNDTFLQLTTELSGVKVEVKMEEDKKTRRQGDRMMEYKKTRKQEDKTNVLQAGTVAVLSSKSNVLYSCIPVFLYSKPKCLTLYLTSFYNFRNLNYAE